MSKPLEVTALLMTVTAKCDGDMRAETKGAIIGFFEDEFKLPPRDASALLSSSAYLLRDGEEVRANVEKVLTPSRDSFTPEQTASALSLIGRVAESEGRESPVRVEFIDRVRTTFDKRSKSQGKWD